MFFRGKIILRGKKVNSRISHFREKIEIRIMELMVKISPMKTLMAYKLN
jgi:hypothetical protein